MSAPTSASPRVVGLLLAAGSGSRLGQPKALLSTPEGGSLIGRAVQALRDGGCRSTYVVLGASAHEARLLVPDGTEVVVAADWSEGMGASLRAGLGAVARDLVDATAVVVTLVDMPGVTGDVVRRLLASGPSADALARATYRGELGHPVLIGRDHWAGVGASARGDRGARDYLAQREVLQVECADLADGVDLDTRQAWDDWLASDARP